MCRELLKQMFTHVQPISTMFHYAPFFCMLRPAEKNQQSSAYLCRFMCKIFKGEETKNRTADRKKRKIGLTTEHSRCILLLFFVSDGFGASMHKPSYTFQLSCIVNLSYIMLYHITSTNSENKTSQLHLTFFGLRQLFAYKTSKL